MSTEPFSRQLKRWQVYNPHARDFIFRNRHPSSFVHSPAWKEIRVPAGGFADLPHACFFAMTVDGADASDVHFQMNSSRARFSKTPAESAWRNQVAAELKRRGLGKLCRMMDRHGWTEEAIKNLSTTGLELPKRPSEKFYLDEAHREHRESS